MGTKDEMEREPLTPERNRKLLERAVPGAEELDEQLKRVFALPERELRLR
jgi:hypothetical protein